MGADVKRYVMTGDGAMVEPKCHAEFFADAYVRESDYAALAQERDGANERARMMFDAKNHWAERATAAESERDALKARIAEMEVVEVCPVLGGDWVQMTRKTADSLLRLLTRHPDLYQLRVRLVLDDDTAATLRRGEG